MKHTDHTQHSKALGRDMHVFVYGTSKGYPVLVFPTQDAMAGQYEEFGMVDELAELIEAGKIQLFCVDTVDTESWSNSDGDKEARAERQEQYYHFICDEVVPFVQKQNKSKRLPLATGCSLGGTHSAIFALRRPDLFQGCIALSGCYDAKYFFGGWMNEVLYDNSPVHFMENLPTDHPYVKTLSERDLVFCVGQGAWEDEGIRTTGLLKQYFDDKGIDAWFDFWGFDVSHDWTWWKKQISYFMPIVLEDIEKQEVQAAAAAKKPAARKTAAKSTAAKSTATKAAAKEPAKASAAKSTATKSAAKSTTTKAAAAKSTAAKATATKAAAKTTAAKTAAKSTATKTAATKPAAKATTAKASASKTAAKSTATKTTAAKSTAAKAAAEPKVTKIAPSKAVQEALGAKKTPARSSKAKAE